MPNSPLTIITDKTAGIEEALKKLAKTQVLVGVPSDDEGGSNDRSDSNDINNATLLYIHENGSPINNLPARPSLGPGVEESTSRWGDYFKQAAEAALEGDDGRMDRALNAAGITAVSAVKRKIQAGIPPPLSPRTIEGRRRRHKGRQASSGPADTTPLIDTGAMINSITYVVRKKK